MKIYLVGIYLYYLQVFVYSQDLLLVIDEQFANKTFMGFDDLEGQILGELYWSTYVGGNPFIYTDIGDGLGPRNLHYYIQSDDDIWTFTRPENAYTNSEGLVMEAKPYPDINHYSTTSNNQIGTGISLYYPWSFRRGYFEIRAKLPSGEGIQSAFHLFGDLAQIPGFDCDNGEENDKNWQEIDIWETGGSGPNTLRNNIHWSAALETPPPFENFYSCDVECSHCQFGYRGVDCMTEYDFTTEFHTIGLYWDEQYVIFLLNGDIYRYWVKVIPGPLNCNDHPDPIQLGDPRKILFTDAMVLNLGIGYGVSGPYEYGAQPGNLNGPNPNAEMPASQLEVEYFRYWTFLPCENQLDISITLVNSNEPQFAFYQNDKTITGYNEYQYGHYETGRYIECSNSFIGPNITGGIEPPYWYSDQLNLIGSREIHLTDGFHAKAAEENLPIPHQFRAQIQKCSNISPYQPMPLINNQVEIDGFTFIENFMSNIGEKIYESYTTDGPLRSNENVIVDETQQQFTLSTSDNKFIQYTFFPNPAIDEITIVTNPELENGRLKYEITNNLGYIIMTDFIETEREVVNISGLAGGVYYIKFYSDSEIEVHQFVKI